MGTSFTSILAILGSGVVPASASVDTPAHHAVHAANPLGTSPLAVQLTRAGTGKASSAVNPKCHLFFMDANGNPGGGAHISTFLWNKHKIRAVKINARIKCQRVSINLFLQVTLWKTGLLFPHKVAGPTTATAAKGSDIKNQKTWRQCNNNANSTYYGTAFGSVVIQGVLYAGSLMSKKAPLACGT
jgi:hypothetical protein